MTKTLPLFPNLRYTPIIRLAGPGLHALHVSVNHGPEPRAEEPMLADWPGGLSSARIAIDAHLVDDARMAALAPQQATIVVHAPTLVRRMHVWLGEDQTRWRSRGFRTALAQFSGTRIEIEAVLSHHFDEVWISSQLTRALPLESTPARGLLTEFVQLLGRRRIDVIAGEVLLVQQLEGARELGLTGAYGPVLGAPMTAEHLDRLARGGYIDTGAP